MVLDVSNPAVPDSCNYFGGVNNGIGTWGISRNENEIYLSYICTLGIPFSSNYTGIKIITYDPCLTSENEITSGSSLQIYPNPVHEELVIDLSFISANPNIEIRIYDALGKLITIRNFIKTEEIIKIDTKNMEAGMYHIELLTDSDRFNKKLFIKH